MIHIRSLREHGIDTRSPVGMTMADPSVRRSAKPPSVASRSDGCRAASARTAAPTPPTRDRWCPSRGEFRPSDLGLVGQAGPLPSGRSRTVAAVAAGRRARRAERSGWYAADPVRRTCDVRVRLTPDEHAAWSAARAVTGRRELGAWVRVTVNELLSLPSGERLDRPDPVPPVADAETYLT